MYVISEALLIAIIGSVSAAIAGAVLKIVEKILGRSKEKEDRDRVDREELRIELQRSIAEKKELKSELDLTEQSEDRWRNKYWTLFERFFRLRLLALILAKDDAAYRSEIESMEAPHEKEL